MQRFEGQSCQGGCPRSCVFCVLPSSPSCFVRRARERKRRLTTRGIMLICPPYPPSTNHRIILPLPLPVPCGCRANITHTIKTKTAVGSANGILPQHAVRAQEYRHEGGLERQWQLATNVESGPAHQIVRHTRHEGIMLVEGPSQGGNEHRLASRVRDRVRERRHGWDVDILEHW